MPEPRLHALLATSLDGLAAELPSFSALLARALGDRVAHVVVQGEAGELVAEPGRVRWRALTAAPDVVLRTDDATVAAMLRGQLDLVEAVQAGRLDLRGDVEDLVVMDDVLRHYLNGMVRSRCGPGLAARFLGEGR